MNITQTTTRYDKNKWLFMGLFLLIFLLINVGVMRQQGDDIVHLEELKNAGNVFTLLKLRYKSWSGRTLPEFFMYTLLNSKIIIWKILNTFMMLLISMKIYEFSYIGHNDRHNKLMLMLYAGIFTMPVAVFSTGITWITGSFNYLWPVAFGMVCMVVIKRYLDNQKVTNLNFYFAVIASLFACQQEQMAAILLCFNLLAIILYRYIYKKVNCHLIVMQCVIMLISAITLLAPGNKVRYYREITRFYPEFNNLTFLNKSIQALTFSLDRFVNIFRIEHKECNLLFLSISLLIFLLCKKNIKLLSGLPLIYFVIKIFINPTYGYYIFDTDLKNLHTVNGIISVILSVIIFCVMMIGLYCCFESIENKFISVIIFLGAMFSGFVVGFSPTIFDSGARIFFCSYVLFIVVLGMLLSECFIKLKNNPCFIFWQIVYAIYVILMIMLQITKYSSMIIYL